MSLRPLIFALAAIPVATLCAASDARADYAFCSATGSSTRCDFQTYEQCQASVSGTGADCIANPAGPPAASIPAPASTRRHRRH
ncbi:MAG: DUF3551 domain-containing protein [Pseudorhodoplanes sp.]